MRIGSLIRPKNNKNTGLYLIVANLSYKEAGGVLNEEYPCLRYWKLINPNGLSEILSVNGEALFEEVGAL